MATSLSDRSTRSGPRNPCPICGRVKDSSCEIKHDLVFCHRGQTNKPPADLKPGDVLNGWAYVGESEMGRAMFKPDEPKPSGRRPRHLRPLPQPSAAVPIVGPITLARLPEPLPPQPPDHRPNGHVFEHGDSRSVRLVRTSTGKDYYPSPTQSKVPGTWPHYHEAEALRHGSGLWVVEAEGENCCDIIRAGGLVAVSHPGHQRSHKLMVERYQRLVAGGIYGIFRLDDNDQHGREEGQLAAAAANEAGMRFQQINARAVWPGIPEKGSIDDAPGTPAERVAAIEAAASQALSRAQRVDTEGGCLQPQGVRDLDRIRMAADQVAAENLNWSRAQYVHRLREMVEAVLSVPARDDLYRREIGEAIIRRDGIESRPFIGGCELPDDTEEWIIEALILAGALNIIGADPKAGKTLLSVALIANLLHGCQQFIGRDITGRPPTVVIVGPDQPVRLWKKQLKAVGLVQGNILDPRIVQLWDSQNPWAATTEGIAELRQLCAKHPGSLVLFDSFAKVSEKLGIDENSREAAEVLSDIERACIVSRCTPLVIHHNGKSAGRAGIVNGGALRGSGAIRANASQVAVLTLIDQDNPKDPRRRLVTEGRGGEFIDAVIQLEEDGWSWRHVCDYSEHRTAASAQRTREKLSPGQQAALDAVEASRDPLTTAQVWAVLHPEAPWAKDSSDAKALSRTLSGLVQKNLLDRFQGIANRPTFARKEERHKGVTTQGPRVGGVTPVTPCPLLEG